MPFIQSFEELGAWKKAREYAKTIQSLCEKVAASSPQELRSSLLISSGAVMDHIADGFDRSGHAEFLDYLDHARGALAKNRSQLYRVFDLACVTDDVFLDLVQANVEVSKELVLLCDRMPDFDYVPPTHEEPIAAIDLITWR